MPSEKVLQQKKDMVEQLTEKFQKAVSGVFVSYAGLTVEQDTKLRNELREAGVEYKVVKNTLIRFAANNLGMQELDPSLNGPTSIALSYDDVVAPARVLNKYVKEYEDFNFKTGFVEGKIMSLEEIKAMADLPSKEVLLTRTVVGLNAPIQKLAMAVKAIAEKKEQEETA